MDGDSAPRVGQPDGHLAMEPGGLLFGDRRKRRRAAMVLTTLAVLLALWSAPIDMVQNKWRARTYPAYQLSRLDSYWSYFSPEVARTSHHTWVEIVHDDGTRERWDFPGNNQLPFTYRAFRWSKYKDALYRDESLWQQVLLYVERTVVPTLGDNAPVELRLMGAESAPTTGNSGPYDPDYRISVLATRRAGGT